MSHPEQFYPPDRKRQKPFFHYGWIPLTLVLCNSVAGGEFEVRVVDAETNRPVSVRMSIRNQRGALIKQRGVPYHQGSFCFFGSHTFKLPRGVYSYKIEKGLEYQTVSGQFEIKREATDGVTVKVPRFTNMSQRGWWSGDLEIYRPDRDVPVLMDANDLNFAHLTAFDNEGVRFKDGFPAETRTRVNDSMLYSKSGITDSRYGGGLVLVGLGREIPLPKPKTLFPVTPDLNGTKPDLIFLNNASNWETPFHLANLGKENAIDAIAIAGDAVSMVTTRKKRVDLRPPDSSVSGDHPLAAWQTRIYYHALNCGFRIPPVACSGSGRSANPVGYNRVYVHTGQDFSYQKWITNLKKGRVIVTNGPVMNVLFNGVLPGETIQIADGSSCEVETSLTLSLKEKAEYLEIIRNGLVAEKISLDEYAKARGRLPKLTFHKSGWMLVRVVTRNRNAYRFATSGPIYIQIGDQAICKKTSAQFFLDWIVERGRMIRASSAEDKLEALEQLRDGFDFWKEMVARGD